MNDFSEPPFTQGEKRRVEQLTQTLVLSDVMNALRNRPTNFVRLLNASTLLVDMTTCDPEKGVVSAQVQITFEVTGKFNE